MALLGPIALIADEPSCGSGGLWWLIVLVLLVGPWVGGHSLVEVLSLLVIDRVTPTRGSPGADSLVGRTVEAKTALKPRGKVIFQNAIWNAEMKEGEAEEGDVLYIAEVKGNRLFVMQS